MTQHKRRPVKWRILQKRILQHHLPLLALSAAVFSMIYWLLDSDDVIWRISMATAYVSLPLLAATLLTGPLKVLRDRPNPVSDDLTRDIGIWAAIAGIVHVVFGLQVHMRGKMWLLFINEESNVRMDLFGTANYSGLVAAFILLMLLAISNNRSLRTLGANTWKRLQRWNYGLFGLMILHSAAYMILENRTTVFIIAFSLITLIVVTMQALGFWEHKRKTTGDDGSIGTPAG